MNAFITQIGPWTFAYGILFFLLGTLLSRMAGALRAPERVRMALVVIFLFGAFIIMKDIPGTLLAISFYVLLSVSPMKRRVRI